MNAFRRRVIGDGHRYTLLGTHNGSSKAEEHLWRRKHYALLLVLIALAGLAAVFVSRYDWIASEETQN